MKTYTPNLDPAVLQRLRDYAALFSDDFPQAKPARLTGVYLQGLLLDGERNSIESLARRITLPEGLSSRDPEQALQQFVAPLVWLLIEEQADGTLKFAFSNLPVGTSCKKAVRLWKSRWPVEQGYQ